MTTARDLPSEKRDVYLQRSGDVAALSANDPKRTSSKLLIDHFIDLREQRRWDSEAEPLRRFHVDRHLKFCGLLHR